ncbi:hypothetical protein NQ317_018984, partial [Molorchus minor]
TSQLRRILGKYPILTNSIIYGTLCCGAETSQQTISKKNIGLAKSPQQMQIDTGAITRFTIYGTAVGGPILTVWYRFLDSRIPGKSTQIAIKKALLDQFVFTPPLYLVFYVVMSILERKEDVFEEFRNKFVKTFLGSCMFWMPIQGINFFLIPPAFRVVYVGACSFVWLNVISWIKNQ